MMRRSKLARRGLTRAGLVLTGALLFLAACSTTETEEVAAPSVEVSGDVAVEVGATITLTAQTLNYGDQTETYTWASNDEAVATVADGVVTGVAAGTAIITATGDDTGATGTWGVHVFTTGGGGDGTPKVVVGGPISVDIGETITLTAQTIDGTDAAYTWASSDDTIATVADGVVTGVAAGDVTITATGDDTGAAGSWGVYVKPEDTVTPPTPMVTVTGDAMALMVGDTLQLTATTADGTDAGYDWASSDDTVATVDADGLVTGVAAGEAIITATGQDTGAAGTYGVVVFAETEDGVEIPLLEAWQNSPHADATSEAFRHWDDDGEVSASCARCHSGVGLPQYAAGEEVTAAPTDTVVTCTTCHAPSVIALDWVEFPSGVRVENVGKSARCMACHQGRQSTVSVDEHIAAAEAADDDTVDEDLSFRNVHYFAAGATLYGGVAMGGYQYAGQMYDAKFKHVEGWDTCTTCHDPHTLELRLDGCNTCHDGVATREDLHDIRMAGSLVDYDGDGDMEEGVYYEIQTLHENLIAAIEDYAANTAGTAIVYDSSSYPYWFDDQGERYGSWTPRLIRAAYNYQYVAKDPGGFAHNPKYIIELLYDSLADLGAAGDAMRIDAGHFAGSQEAWRHWDEDGEVSASCARCHSDSGLETYLLTGGNLPVEPANGMLCTTCHVEAAGPTLYAADEVEFPSGAVIDSGSAVSNVCMQCHQGRESGADVAALIGDLPLDEVSDSLRFLNVHYFAAGATRYGTEAGGGFEYEGSLYNGYFVHTPMAQQCDACHGVHDLKIKVDVCGDCHEGVETADDLHDIRMPGSVIDYDGDGDTAEGIALEIEHLEGELYAAIQAYADATAGVDAIIYDSHSYPYWFVDTNGNGLSDEGEANYGNRFATWTPRLLKAAYNYQYAAKDPGGFAHNARYVIQLIWDSIDDLAAAPGVTIDTTGLVRNPGAHFDGTSEAFRHWDEDGAVEPGCAQCHGGPAGLEAYLENYEEPTDAVPISMGLTCETCHTGEDYAGDAPLKNIEKVVFPSGIEVTNDDGDSSFLCMTCHQGRVSKADIDAAIADDNLRFLNIHYLAAGAILYGADAQVGYEYDGNTYAGQWTHAGPGSASCTFCHNVTAEEHSYEPVVTQSGCGCHAGVTDIHEIRINRPGDYDGDGDTAEPLRDEIEGLSAILMTQIQSVAAANGAPLLYDDSAYPYWFNDNGEPVGYGNRYTAWTGPLMKAAHNYQAAHKEPGSWAHNTIYIVQLLMDSIVDLGGDLATVADNPLTRPE